MVKVLMRIVGVDLSGIRHLRNVSHPASLLAVLSFSNKGAPIALRK
jgi:hypothetical protein